MANTLFKQNGGIYTQQGNYFLPDVRLPDQPEFEIGVWGQSPHLISYDSSIVEGLNISMSASPLDTPNAACYDKHNLGKRQSNMMYSNRFQNYNRSSARNVHR